ncbi:MAG: amino acid permease, partial [Actinomycetota bacterium]
GDSFQPGPWTLGAKGKVIGWIAVIWVLFIVVILMMPQFSPGGLGLKTIDVLNYTPIVVGSVVIITGLWWVVSAHKWFTGPKVQGSAEELAAIEADLELKHT